MRRYFADEDRVRGIHVSRVKVLAIFLPTMMIAFHHPQNGDVVLNDQQIEDAINALRQAYAAFNRGDIDAAVRILDPGVEWVEPPEFPGGGT